MIYVDASAIVALALNEPEAKRLGRVFDAGDQMCTQAIAIYEAAMAIGRELELPFDESHAEVMAIISRGCIGLIDVTDITAFNVLRAQSQFGKGRHPAKLNTGGCFGYAIAKSHDARILFVGDDFTQTDLVSALPVS
jgi:ribonuclease VapC